MNSKTLVFLFFTLTAASAAAQRSVHIPDADATKGGCNGLPFGVFDSPAAPYYAKEIKYQTLLTVAQLGTFAPRVIRELGFASCQAGVQEFTSIVIKMDWTSATKLDKTFAKNLTSNAVKVLDARNYLWHRQKDEWSRIGLEKAFPFLPGKNLVVDIEVRGARFLTSSFGPVAVNSGGFHGGGGRVPRLFADVWKTPTQPPAIGRLGKYGIKIQLSSELSALGRFGKGCLGNGKVLPSLGFSKNSIAKTGNTVTIELSSGLPSFPITLILGFGGSKLPYKPVALTGFSGCNLYLAPQLMIPNVTNATGAASTPIAIPNMPILLNVAFFVQYFQPELNPLALRASNYGRVLIGR